MLVSRLGEGSDDDQTPNSDGAQERAMGLNYRSEHRISIDCCSLLLGRAIVE